MSITFVAKEHFDHKVYSQSRTCSFLTVVLVTPDFFFAGFDVVLWEVVVVFAIGPVGLTAKNGQCGNRLLCSCTGSSSGSQPSSAAEQ